MKMSIIDWIAWILLFIGGLNWGLFGTFDHFDLVSKIFGDYTTLSRIVYILVGIAAVWSLISMLGKAGKES